MSDKITESHSVTLVKYSKRVLRGPVIEGNISGIIEGACPRSLQIEGWSVERTNATTYVDMPQTGDYEHKYIVQLTIRYAGTKQPNTTFAGIALTISRKGAMPRFGQWTLAQADDEEYSEPASDDQPATVGESVAYEVLKMPEDYWNHFSHLYGLDAHIGIVKSSIEAAIESEWANRFNCALIGPPGCGKTEIGRAVKGMFGEQSVWEFDATATTAAGVIKELSEADTLPRIIVIEEIEKAPEASLQPLLALLDTRSEVRKVTARKKVQRDIAVLVVATINNEDKFRSMQAGALYSRFMNKIHFREPDWDTLRMILVREITKINGDEAWIAPTIDFCQKHSIRDPRQVIAICLCGRDGLLDNSYQTMLEATSVEAVEDATMDTYEFGDK